MAPGGVAQGGGGTWLSSRARNVASQNGEDGILEAIFDVLGPETRWCVELGAWDGRYLSNTWNLIQGHGWSAVLIERDPRRFDELRANHSGRPGVHCLRASIAFDAPDSLDDALAETPIPRQFGLLSIDIDGNDYHLWESLRLYRPTVVVIEFNPTIPNDVEFVQARDPDVSQGSSLSSILGLGERLGYEAVAVTSWNAFFVTRERYAEFGIEDNSIAALRPENPYETRLYQLFDGTLLLDGFRELLWHDIPLRDRDVQVLPPHVRFAPGESRSRLKNAYQRAWLALRRRSARP